MLYVAKLHAYAVLHVCECKDKARQSKNKRFDRVVRILGGRRMSVSGIIKNIVRHHLSLYEEDFEAWRKL